MNCIKLWRKCHNWTHLFISILPTAAVTAKFWKISWVLYIGKFVLTVFMPLIGQLPLVLHSHWLNLTTPSRVDTILILEWIWSSNHCWKLTLTRGHVTCACFLDHLKAGDTVLTASDALAPSDVDQRSVHVAHVGTAVTMGAIWTQLTNKFAVDRPRSCSCHCHCHAHGGTWDIGETWDRVNIYAVNWLMYETELSPGVSDIFITITDQRWIIDTRN